MMPDEGCDQPIRLGGAGGHLFERVVTFALATRVGFLLGVQRGIGEESVLEIVYSDLCRFLIGDGAQMARNLQTTPVCLFDRGTQFRSRNVFVGLERGHAVIRPIGHGLSCVLRARELLHLEIWIIGSIQVGTSHVEMRAR